MLNVKKVQTIAKLLVASFAILALVVPAILPVAPSFAADDDDIVGSLDKVAGGGAGLQKADLKTTIGKLLKVALGFLGIIAVIVVLIGGFKYMIAGGSEEKVGDAKKWIISGIIGLAIVLSAYAITTFALTSFTNAIKDSPVE